jgi:hypothetical protein
MVKEERGSFMMMKGMITSCYIEGDEEAKKKKKMMMGMKMKMVFLA